MKGDNKRDYRFYMLKIKNMATMINSVLFFCRIKQIL